MADTLPSIDAIEAMIPAMESLESLINQGAPRNASGECYFCNKRGAHEPYCAWNETATALEKWMVVRD